MQNDNTKCRMGMLCVEAVRTNRGKAVLVAGLLLLLAGVLASFVVFRDAKVNNNLSELSQQNQFEYLEKDLNLLLLDAIANNDLDTISKTISAGADVNYKTITSWIFVDNERRKTGFDDKPLPLEYTYLSESELQQLMLDSFERSDEVMVTELFQGESDEQLEGKHVLGFREGSTPLEVATRFGHAEVVSLLVSSGARDIETSIFSAIRKRDVNTLKQLLALKPNVNILSSHKSPLSIAAENNDSTIAQILIENGARIDFSLGEEAPNIDAFDVAIRHGNAEFIDYILTLTPLEEAWKRDECPMHWVIHYNPLKDAYVTEYYFKTQDTRIAVLQALLKHGADINKKCEGKSPLVEAITLYNDEGKVDLVRFLIQQGADVNEQTEYTDRGSRTHGRTRSLLDLVNDLVAEENSVDSVETKGLLEKSGAKSQSMVAEELRYTYDKDLGNDYKQKFYNINRGLPVVSYYYHDKWLTNVTLSNSSTTLDVLNRFYATDGKLVWFRGEIVAGAHAETFQTLGDGYGFYGKDMRAIFAYGKELVGSNSSTYRFVGEYFLQSGENVYYEFKQIIGADAESFIVNNWPYARDKYRVYREDKIVEDLVPETSL